MTEQAGGSCIHAKYTCFSLTGYHGLTPVSNQTHTATHSSPAGLGKIVAE